jgi:hypothetical protein
MSFHETLRFDIDILSRNFAATEETHMADRGSATSTPRWLPVLGIAVAIVLVVLLVVLHLTGTLGPGAH